jgi:hypothetical protein
MTKIKKILGVSLATVLVITAASCSPQRSSPNTSMGGGAQSGPATMPGMSGMSGMPGHDMSGMDMSSMMTHCAQMRQQMAQGQPMSPEMAQMMTHCDQMDRQMGMPSATRSR